MMMVRYQIVHRLLALSSLLGFMTKLYGCAPLVNGKAFDIYGHTHRSTALLALDSLSKTKY